MPGPRATGKVRAPPPPCPLRPHPRALALALLCKQERASGRPRVFPEGSRQARRQSGDGDTVP